MDFNTLLGEAKAKREDKSRFKLDEILANVPPSTAQAILLALEDTDNSDVVIVEALKGMDFKISESSVRRYRSEVLGIK